MYYIALLVSIPLQSFNKYDIAHAAYINLTSYSSVSIVGLKLPSLFYKDFNPKIIYFFLNLFKSSFNIYNIHTAEYVFTICYLSNIFLLSLEDSASLLWNGKPKYGPPLNPLYFILSSPSSNLQYTYYEYIQSIKPYFYTLNSFSAPNMSNEPIKKYINIILFVSNDSNPLYLFLVIF